jgi:hypothetical protein
MFTSKEIDRYRNGLLTQAQQEKDRLLAERQKINNQLVEAEATLVRLNAPFPEGEYCPLCFYALGIVTVIQPIGADPKRPRIDLWRCSRKHTFEDGKL